MALPDAFFVTEDVKALVGEWTAQCGRRVRNRRELMQWDRRSLAAIAGTTEATIHRIETGGLNPRDHLRLILAAAMQVEVADIWDYPSRAEVYANAGRA